MDVLLQPETDPQVLAACLVRDPREVSWVLAQLLTAGGRLALYPAARPVVRVPGRLVRCTGTVVEIAGNGEPLHGHEPLIGKPLLAVGSLRDVKIQFVLDKPAAIGPRADPTLRGAAPAALHRIQRREAHRVRPWPAAAIRIQIMEPGETNGAVAAAVEYECPVVDLSTDSIGLLLPARATPPAIGARLVSAWLELPDREPIACELEVKRVVPAVVTGDYRVGCRLRLDPPGSRTLACALLRLQRR
ncbi:MAG: PilZ domain-containing protein [Burkholderiaceae bacterium]